MSVMLASFSYQVGDPYSLAAPIGNFWISEPSATLTDVVQLFVGKKNRLNCFQGAVEFAKGIFTTTTPAAIRFEMEMNKESL